MPNVDDLPVKALNDVDWDRLTEQQAAGFGLSLGVLNDAVEQHDKAKAVFAARLSSLLIASIVGVTLLTWTNPTAAVIGTSAALALNTAVTWWHTRRTARAVRLAQQELDSDVAALPKG